MKKYELKQIIREEISNILKPKHNTYYQNILNEKIDMSQAELGQITPYGTKVSTYTYGLRNGLIELSTLKFNEAKSIADDSSAAGFDAEAKQVRGIYYDGYVYIKAPRTHDDIIKMAGIIEDKLGHLLVNDNGKRVRKTGKL
jgi:hypothetical protein